MSQNGPGWYPCGSADPADDQNPSWRDLADAWPECRASSFRRFWNGSRWEGARVPNADLLAIAVCPGCERRTGFVSLSEQEGKGYMAGAIMTGSELLANPRKIPKRLLRAWQSKDALKCID